MQESKTAPEVPKVQRNFMTGRLAAITMLAGILDTYFETSSKQLHKTRIPTKMRKTAFKSQRLQLNHHKYMHVHM